MNTRSRESSATGPRKSGRVRQKRSLGQDYVNPEECPIEENIFEQTAKRKKSPSSSTPTPNQQLNEMVATAIATKEIKQEEDVVQEKPSAVQNSTQRKWSRPEIRRSSRPVKPSTKALECDMKAMKEIKTEEEVAKDDNPDEDYYPSMPDMPAPSTSSAQNLVARCPSKVTVNPRLRRPVMYTGAPDLCEKRKPMKATGSRPINRLRQKIFNPSMTPVDGAFANVEPMSPETEERLSKEAEEAVAQIRAASVQKILEKRSRGKFSSGGQAAAQNKEIERFVINSVNPEKAIEQLAESLNRKKTLTPPEQQAKSHIVQSKQPQFVREGVRTVAALPVNKQTTVTEPRFVKTIRTPDSRLVTVSAPLRLAIAPKHRLPIDTQLKMPKEEVDDQKEKTNEGGMRLTDLKVEELDDPFFEQKPETIEPMKPAAKELPGVKRQEPHFSQLPMRIDRETGKLYLPKSTSSPGAPSVTIGAASSPKYYAMKTVSHLKTPKPLGSQITTRTVTVLPKMLYVNKDGSAPGPSTASDDLPPSLPPNPLINSRKLRKIITEQTMVRVPPLKSATLPMGSPHFTSLSKPVTTPQPVRKLFIDPKTAKIVQPKMMARDADGKPIATRRIIIAHPKSIQKVAENGAQPEKTVEQGKTFAALREFDKVHNTWKSPEFDHAYCKPFSKKPMSPDRIISKTYIPPVPMATPIIKYLGNRDRELRAVTADDNMHPQQPQFIEEKPIEQKPTGLIEEHNNDIKQEVDDEDVVEVPKPETKRADMVPYLGPRRMVMVFHPPKMNSRETNNKEEEEELERSPSPEKVYLGAQEPMKDLDEDVYRFNRVTIKRCKSFTAKELRPFGKRPPGHADKPPGPGLSVCMLEETDEEQYNMQKQIEDEWDKQEREERAAKIEAEMLRQKEALALRLVKNESTVWKYMQSDGFKNLQKPEEEMMPFEKILLQHDALAKIPAYSETLSHSNPKLFRNLQNVVNILYAEKRNAPPPVREHKPRERYPQVFGRVSGPIQVNLHDAKEDDKADGPDSSKKKEPKMLNVLWNDVAQQVPDQIPCHLCKSKMRLCMRKSNYRGELREYPAYRCLRKGCQTFRSIKKFIEGTPVYMTKKKHQPLIKNDKLATFVPSSKEEFMERKTNIEMNLRPRQVSKYAKMSEEFVVEESAADIARKDLEAEESPDEDDELTAKSAQESLETDEDDELVGWEKFPGTGSNSTRSGSVASPSYEENIKMEDYEDYSPDNEIKNEEEDNLYAFETRTEEYNFEDYIEEEPMEPIPQEIMREPKEEPIEYDEYFETPIEREVKEEIIDEAFEDMIVVQETKPEFLLHTSEVNS